MTVLTLILGGLLVLALWLVPKKGKVRTPAEPVSEPVRFVPRPVGTVHIAGLDAPEAAPFLPVIESLNRLFAGHLEIVTTAGGTGSQDLSGAFSATPHPVLRFEQPVNAMPIVHLPPQDTFPEGVLEDTLFLRLLSQATGSPLRDLRDHGDAARDRIVAWAGTRDLDAGTLDPLYAAIVYGDWFPDTIEDRERLIHRAVAVLTPPDAATDPQDAVTWRTLQALLRKTLDELGRPRDALAVAEAEATRFDDTAAHSGVAALRFRLGLQDGNEAWVEAALDLWGDRSGKVAADNPDDPKMQGFFFMHDARDYLAAGRRFDRPDWLRQARDYARLALERGSYATPPKDGGDDWAGGIIAEADRLLAGR